MPKNLKSWSESTCRDRFVRGEPISFRQLAKEARVHPGTLSRWSKTDPEGTWDEQRERYHQKLRASIDHRRIAQVSQSMGDELAGLTIEHFKLHKQGRMIAALYIETKIKLLKEAQHQGLDALVKEFRTTKTTDLNNISQILDRHLKGERIAMGLEYEDLNKAIAAVTRAGFEVSEKSDDENTTAEDESQD